MPAQDPTLNFEDLLQTVKESERGRWFLAEFEARLHKSDTGNILSAIHKLEGVIASQGQSGIDSVLVARTRAAIAAARREIANLDRQNLTDEGRLFARLADMARAAFSTDEAGTGAVNAGVSRALLLVDQLDQDFAAASAPDAKVGYFAPDAEVFERPRIEAAKPVDAQPAVLPKPVVKDVERGARLVIRKTGESEAPQVAPAPEVVEAAVPVEAAPAVAPQPAADITSIAPNAAKQSRVVIIRRKPEELMDVPLPDANSAESAA